MERNPVAWFEIYVDDMERAKAFYEKTLALQLQKLEVPGEETPQMVMWAFPMHQNGPGAAGTLVKMEGFSAGKNSTLVYFSCEDCAVEAKRAQKNGGKIQQEKMSIGPYGHIALVVDTEGNMFGLHSMK